MTLGQWGSPCLDGGEQDTGAASGPPLPKHLFPEPTVRRVGNLEPLSVPLPRASPSTCCIPAPGGVGKVLDREQGLGSRDVFHAATFLIGVKSLKAPWLLSVSFAPRPGPGCTGSSSVQWPLGSWGTRTWRSGCLLLQSSPFPLPCDTCTSDTEAAVGAGHWG